MYRSRCCVDATKFPVVVQGNQQHVHTNMHLMPCHPQARIDAVLLLQQKSLSACFF
nr:MAG TPA: hypothetical protein [Caudoviricetes sp.]